MNNRPARRPLPAGHPFTRRFSILADGVIIERVEKFLRVYFQVAAPRASFIPTARR